MRQEGAASEVAEAASWAMLAGWAKAVGAAEAAVGEEVAAAEAQLWYGQCALPSQIPATECFVVMGLWASDLDCQCTNQQCMQPAHTRSGRPHSHMVNSLRRQLVGSPPGYTTKNALAPTGSSGSLL